MALPTALPGLGPADPSDRPPARVVSYTVERDADNEFLDFGVDGMPFDPTRDAVPDQARHRRGVDPRQRPDAKLHEHAHVFHIHVNPFKVTKINGKALDTPLWRDTFVLTGNDGDSITFESNFVDFTGQVRRPLPRLTHEDLGMMEIIEVVQ